jgi:hypothetical protein
MHHHLINKTTNVMQLEAIVFIIPWKALYMFRVLFIPIIRSVLKLYMQLLIQSPIGMVSDPLCYKMMRSRERAPIGDCTNNCMYSFKTLLMMGVKSTRNMYNAFQGIIKKIAPSCITLVVLLINSILVFVKPNSDKVSV